MQSKLLSESRKQSLEKESFYVASSSQWLKNIGRIFLFVPTQLFMASGIFPAQAISTLKKVPGIKSIIGFIARKTGKDSRSALEIFNQDFQENLSAKPVEQNSSWFDWFTKNPKIKRFEQADQLVTQYTKTPYQTDFGRDVTLETFSFTSAQFDTIPEEDRYYRIHCSGNAGNCGRFFGELAQLSINHPELKTITYNHPGVEGSNSITMSQDDLVNALFAQVIALLKEGVAPSHIELTGFSIGAATAAQTAKKLQDYRSKLYPEGIHVNLFCDRTLSTMANVVTDKLPVLSALFNFIKLIPGIKEIVHYLIQPIIKFLVITPLLYLINWNMNPAAAYNEIPAERKALTVVKPKTVGSGDGIGRLFLKYLGMFTGWFKEGNGDKTIAKHVSLLSGTEDDENRKTWKKELSTYAEKPNENLLYHLKESAPNAIAANALSRLEHVEETAENPQELIHLAQFANKGRRLQGTTESDAHNVTADLIEMRSISKDPEKHIRTDAFKAAHLSKDSPNTLLTYYSMFHQAVKSNNQLKQQSEHHETFSY
ncbi:SdbA protein, substrate of the Dot/Icm system [Legionella steigerwaltii]|uniref:SdbA protein, substrate of the Dot/Icm system n=1 Tax=Legionella steigerwaltii TaxID=460 RepID=A0A378LI40_9GAMM|nr:hypothetical protein [Legionella steigerwaltii]KTD75718.1 SdbA protein, substrate of the Dot/Icm system [Legionella steigerwaltii]STY23771.1 SdbA protein, substrate of the Dot/Icm system [Legionella steigerwaltii]